MRRETHDISFDGSMRKFDTMNTYNLNYDIVFNLLNFAIRQQILPEIYSDCLIVSTYIRRGTKLFVEQHMLERIKFFP